MSFDSNIGDLLRFELEVQGLSKIIIVDAKGVQKAEHIVEKPDMFKRTTPQIKFDSNVTIPAILQYNVKAYDGNGHLKMNTFRKIRFVPNPRDHLQLTAGTSLQVPFGEAKYVAQYDT